RRAWSSPSSRRGPRVRRGRWAPGGPPGPWGPVLWPSLDRLREPLPGVRTREQPRAEDYSRHEGDCRYARAPDGARAVLGREDGEGGLRGKVGGVDDAVREDQEAGEDVAR